MPVQTTIKIKPTVSIETQGCKLNQADSSVLALDFIAAGFDIVSPNEPADVFVVNTCTVTHIADRKSRHALRSARRLNPNATIVATGCYAQRAPTILRDLAEVDLVIGNTGKATLVKQVVEWKKESMVPCSIGTDSQILQLKSSRTRAMVKIQEGCNQICAYCIVPKVRGRERSIPPDQILHQINEYISSGYKEVVLTGTQLGSYGFDIPDINLAGLITRILNETEVLRLRVSSLQAQEIDSNLLSNWADPRLCPHFHLALQSGSDNILKKMRRRYNSQQYREAITRIRDTVPNVSITTDIIAGFPSETNDDFELTRAMCESIGFSDIHVFPYSLRPGTSAAYFDETVDPETKSQRVHTLLSISQRHATIEKAKSIGLTRPVLWEKTTGPNYWTGLTDTYIRVMGYSPKQLENEITLARLFRQDGNIMIVNIT